MEMKQRPGFMVYFADWDMPRKLLDAEGFKAFFDAIFFYAKDGKLPQPMENTTAQVFFDSFTAKIDIDNEHYNKVCRERSEAAKKSHRNRKSNSEQLPAIAANINTNNNTNYNINTNNNTNTTTNNNNKPNSITNDRLNNNTQNNGNRNNTKNINSSIPEIEPPQYVEPDEDEFPF